MVDKVLQGNKCCFLFQQQEAKTFDRRVTEFCEIAELHMPLSGSILLCKSRFFILFLF